MTDTEKLAIVVVTFNSADVLPGLIHSLPMGLGDYPYELLVADNNSQDETVSTLEALAPTSTLIAMGRNAGYAAGINAAVHAADDHSAILILNPDVRLKPGCVTELLRALREPGVGIAVPRLTDARGNLILSIRRDPRFSRALGDALLGAERAGRAIGLSEMVSDPLRYAIEQDIDWAEGSTQMVSAACWAACGEWDESYFLYSEETEFDLRARDRGFKIRFVPTAGGIHLEGDSATSPRLWSLLVTNRVRLYRRRRGMLRAIPFWAAVLLREVSRAALGKSTSKAAVAALLNLRGFRQQPGPGMIS